MLYYLCDENHNVLSEIWAENLNHAVHIAKTNLRYMQGYYVKKQNLGGKWILN